MDVVWHRMAFKQLNPFLPAQISYYDSDLFPYFVCDLNK